MVVSTALDDAALEKFATAPRCLDEVEQASRIAVGAYARAQATGSAPALTALQHLRPLSLRHRDQPAARRYLDLTGARSPVPRDRRAGGRSG